MNKYAISLFSLGAVLVIALVTILHATPEEAENSMRKQIPYGPSQPRPLLSVPITIRLDFLSGLPNPTWQLSKEQAEQLVNILFSAPHAAEGQDLFMGLGYRGFVAESEDESGDTIIIRVQDGMIELQTSSTVTFLKDTDRAIEQLLLASGRAHLKPELYNLIKKQITEA